jgi:hypothetical protein
VSIQKPKSEFEQQMIYLEAEIRRLEAEFNMFFAGRLPRPPWETRAKVNALVKKHDQSFIRNTADRFRFESLQNRYQKFLELWERQMTNRELGRPIMGKRAAPPPPPPKQKEEKVQPKGEPADPALVRFKRDQGLAEDRVKELHAQLTEAKKQAGESPVAIDRLAALVKAQVEKFKSEGQDVTFKVAVKDGKVSLTATPVKDE